MKLTLTKLIILGIVFLSLISVNEANAQNLTIDLANQHQIIRGFGGIHINAWTGQQLNNDMCEKAFDNDPGEIGLSIFRIWVDPEKNGWNAELPAAKYAVSKGAIVFASPWNPPSNMKEELRKTDQGTDYRLLSQYYGAYTDHLNSFIDHMNSNEVPLYAISVQNEPDWHSWTWWEPNEMLKFVRENAQNINCRVIAPESFSYSRKMIDPLLNDSIANSNIDILGTHLYGTPKSNFYYPLAYQKGKEIWMTEHLYGSDKPADNTWELALQVAEEINTCMDARMSAFVYWYIRRFYGLIDDSGNITDKGYVMSHFSKFVRPGSYRVEMPFNAGTNITATAYKNDSTLAIVVVNRSNNAATLNFNIENNLDVIDSMTQFTTTALKKVNNEGTFTIENGSFSASVEPMSITTFTSDPAHGGKYNNESPVAIITGENEVPDNEGTGVTVTLNGAESTDNDGQIVKYSWAKDGYQFANTPEIQEKLELGKHIFALTVTDNDGATASSTFTVNVYNNNSTECWLEAECASIVGENWDIIQNSAVSEGKYLTVKNEFESAPSPTADTTQHLTYSFTVEESGTYKVWGRILVPSPNDDSFWVRVDNGEWVNWNSIPGGSSWAWDDVHNQSNESTMFYTLEPGNHTLYICYRENGAAIDKLYITNTGKVPSGLGGEASSCPEIEEPEIPNGFQSFVANHTIKVFPNPTKSKINIESLKPLTSLNIFNCNGLRVYSKTYTDETFNEEIELQVEAGIYFLQTITEKNYSIQKLIIENQ